MNPSGYLPTTFAPSPNYFIDQATLARIAALFSVSPAVVPGSYSGSSVASAVVPRSASNSSSSSTNTTFASLEIENTVSCYPRTTPGPIRNKRQRLEFCKVCQKSITEEGKRSQGPRRHILMNHLCRPLFFCPYPNCKATSNYDKAHITNHIKRIHNNIGEVIVVEKQKYAEEEDRWFKLCFGAGSEQPSNDIATGAVDENVMENIAEASGSAVYPATVYQDSDNDTDDIYEENEDVDIEALSTPAVLEAKDDVKENIMEAPCKPLPPIPFTIHWILRK